MDSHVVLGCRYSNEVAHLDARWTSSLPPLHLAMPPTDVQPQTAGACCCYCLSHVSVTIQQQRSTCALSDVMDAGFAVWVGAHMSLGDWIEAAQNQGQGFYAHGAGAHLVGGSDCGATKNAKEGVAAESGAVVEFGAHFTAEGNKPRVAQLLATGAGSVVRLGRHSSKGGRREQDGGVVQDVIGEAEPRASAAAERQLLQEEEDREAREAARRAAVERRAAERRAAGGWMGVNTVCM